MTAEPFINGIGNRNLTVSKKEAVIEFLTETLNFNDDIFDLELFEEDAEVKINININNLRTALSKNITLVNNNYQILETDRFILVDTSEKRELILPEGSFDGQKITVKDITGNADKRPITILTTSPDTINSKTKAILNLKYISIDFIFLNNNWNII